MNVSRRSPAWILLVLGFGACSGQQASDDGAVVARVDGSTLPVDVVVALIAEEQNLPASADMVEAVAELWIDYTLLARAAAEDSTLAMLDFGPMVQARLDRNMLVALRDSAVATDTQEAESRFVADVEARAGGLTMTDDALALTRELAANPAAQLSGQAARRTLVEWDTGGLTAARLLELLQQESASLQQEVAESRVETLETFLMSLARRELLLTEARASGLEPPPERADSMATAFAEEIKTSARRLGLLSLDRAPGERLEPAIARAVREGLGKNLSRASPALSLGPLSHQLRSETSHAILNAGLGRAVLQLSRIRAGRGVSAEEGSTPTTPSPLDSIGS